MTGKNIITLGDGNVVNGEFSDLNSWLDEIEDTITQSQDLDEAEKLNLAVDIKSIKDQLGFRDLLEEPQVDMLSASLASSQKS